VHGLNSRARCDVVRELVLHERACVICLVETKVDVLITSMVYDLMGTYFDYLSLPAMGASGGILVGWSCQLWARSRTIYLCFSASVVLQTVDGATPSWSMCTIYGPINEASKPDFLTELRDVNNDYGGELLLLGDFNMIY